MYVDVNPNFHVSVDVVVVCSKVSKLLVFVSRASPLF